MTTTTTETTTALTPGTYASDVGTIDVWINVNNDQTVIYLNHGHTLHGRSSVNAPGHVIAAEVAAAYVWRRL